MKVLLTGSTGFLGKIILETIKNEHQIIELSRKSGNYKAVLEEGIIKFTESFDLVIHSAGKAHSLPKTEREIRAFHEVNVTGTENLLKSLEVSELPKQFVFISSVSVYGQETGSDILEGHSLLAKDPYGISKIKAEKLVEKWCLDNDVKCTILRLPLLVGKNPPGNLGAMIKAIELGYYFNINGGKAKKSMVLARDVAKFIPTVAAVGGIYNLTDGANPSFNQLSLAILGKKSFNLPLSLAKFIGK
ncbi:NAD-dependent epimerase/dehydratase family protein [Flavobacterium sp. N502536]|uniref:NAD-dependent epimerase/dehydratase family protein n=1 Tax=Flavobacterium sp. N502536 TaxID=2986837 RepID=UPI0022221A10|nr:NAD-dependent epimerase/dehydratase family protein [Flavobacterium sp. N502536]